MKRIVLYPFLFVLYTVLNPLVYNLDQIDPTQAARPLGVLLGAALLGIAAIWFRTRNWHLAGYMTFLGLVFFLAFGHIHRLLQPWLGEGVPGLASITLLLAWGGLVFGAGAWFWKRFSRQGWLTQALNLILALALVAPALEAPGQLIAAAQQAESEEGLPIQAAPPALDCSQSPDIYYIILDAYGRGDVLKEMYGLDNEAFLDFLEQKGFYVARESFTNYTQTIFSIPSALNFTYIPANPPGVSGWEYFSSLTADNRLLKALEECGYRTIALESGFSFTENPDVDLYLQEDGGLNDFENLLVSDSPIELVIEDLDLEASEFSYPAHRERVLYSFEQLRRLPQIPGPKFVFAHILTPHPPFVFDAQGNPVEPRQSYAIGDGDDYPGSWQEYRSGYPAQVQYANQKLEQTLTSILEGSDRPPVILLQGDHGPGGRLDWDSPETSCLWERTGILNAYYLPDGAADGLYPTISPVNSFRVVLNTYFGAHLDLLPDRTYFTSHRLERQVIDITSQRTSRLNCLLPEENGANP